MIFRRSLMGPTLRVALSQQSSRVYGSAGGGADAGAGRLFHSLCQTSQTSHSLSGLLKNFKVEIHPELSVPRNLAMKPCLVKGLEKVSSPYALNFRNYIYSGKPAEAENETPSGSTNFSPGLMQGSENTATPRPLDYAGRQESRNWMNERRQLYAENERPSGSMNYVRGLMQDNENAPSGRPRQENGNWMAGRRQLYQPQLESNADIVHIKLLRNNAFVTVTDSKGNKKFGSSAGEMAEKGVAKVGRYSGEATAEEIGRKVKQMKTKSVVVKVNGSTFFRRKKDAILSFKDGYTNSRGDMNPVVFIEDTTRKPHNGCRLPKKRRI